MINNQTQVKISLSNQLNSLLKFKADRLGLPVTQLIKFIIVKEVESENSVFVASPNLEKISGKAIKEIDNSLEIKNVDKYFKSIL